MPKYTTANGNFKTEEEAIKNVIENQVYPLIKKYVNSESKADDFRYPVCVKNEYSKNEFSFGVQFWTKSEMEIGQLINTDRSVSYLCKLTLTK